MPLGIIGLGEVGMTGVAAAIANAVHHATGRRIRDLPITLDRLLWDDGPICAHDKKGTPMPDNADD